MVSFCYLAPCCRLFIGTNELAKACISMACHAGMKRSPAQLQAVRSNLQHIIIPASMRHPQPQSQSQPPSQTQTMAWSLPLSQMPPLRRVQAASCPQTMHQPGTRLASKPQWSAVIKQAWCSPVKHWLQLRQGSGNHSMSKAQHRSSCSRKEVS